MTFDWFTILPFLFLAGGGTAVYLGGVLVPRSRYLSFILAFTAVILCIIAAVKVPPAAGAYGGLLEFNDFGRFYTILLAVIAAISMLLLERYARDREFDGEVLYGTILFAVLGMTGIACASNWLIFFLSFELLSLALYVLIAIRRGQTRSYEAALKYFVMGAVASGFLVFGIGLLYSATGSLAMSGDNFIAPASLQNILVYPAIILIMTGVGFKISLVPFHLWTPDVYEGAPAPITAFLATGSKISLFAALVRLTASLTVMPAPLLIIFWLFAALTMLLGNITALVQVRVKRLLAYSSIAHMGYLFMALLAGRNTGMTAVIFYSAVYGIMDLAAFGALGLMSDVKKDINRLEDFRGMGYRRPAAAMLFAFSLIALAGFPPTAGFTGKFLLFTAAFKSGFIWLGLIGIFSAILSVYFYQKIAVALYMKDADKGGARRNIGWAGAFAGALLLLLLFIFGIMPASLLNMIDGFIGSAI